MGRHDGIRLKPSQIRFSQNSVFYKFYGRSKTLNEEVDAFVWGWTSSVDDIPAMSTVIKDRKIFSLDNRRLYLFRALERRGYVSDVPVNVRAYSSFDSSKFTTVNDGETIAFSDMWRGSVSDPMPVEHDRRQRDCCDIEDMYVYMNASTRERVSSVLMEIEEEERKRKAQEMRKQEEDSKTTPVKSDEELTASESSDYESIVLAATAEEVLVKKAEEDTVEFPQESVLESVRIRGKDEGIISAITDEDSLVLEPSEDEPATVEPIKRLLQEDEENDRGVVSSMIATYTVSVDSGASEPYSDLSEASSEKILQEQELEEHVNLLKCTSIESKTDEVEGIDQELLLSENRVIEENGSGQENNFTDVE